MTQDALLPFQGHVLSQKQVSSFPSCLTQQLFLHWNRFIIIFFYSYAFYFPVERDSLCSISAALLQSWGVCERPRRRSSLWQSPYRNNSPIPSHLYSPNACEISAVRSCQAALELCIAWFERSQTRWKGEEFFPASLSFDKLTFLCGKRWEHEEFFYYYF